jgi:hypothetical protein
MPSFVFGNGAACSRTFYMRTGSPSSVLVFVGSGGILPYRSAGWVVGMRAGFRERVRKPSRRGESFARGEVVVPGNAPVPDGQ